MTAAAENPILELGELRVSYGRTAAVNDVSLSVERGALVGLIGPNGAGKSTLIDAVTGFVSCQGRVLFEGEPLDGLKPQQRVWRGLARTFQTMELFLDLSVRQNLEVSQENSDKGAWRRWGGRDEEAISAALALLELDWCADRRPTELPLGVRKLVGVARALTSGGRMLLLDEPAAGLDSAESAELAGHLRRVRDDGTTILLVDHDMDLVFDACDHVFVLQAGSLLASGSPDQVRADLRVQEAYLGSLASA